MAGRLWDFEDLKWLFQFKFEASFHPHWNWVRGYTVHNFDLQLRWKIEDIKGCSNPKARFFVIIV